VPGTLDKLRFCSYRPWYSLASQAS